MSGLGSCLSDLADFLEDFPWLELPLGSFCQLSFDEIVEAEMKVKKLSD